MERVLISGVKIELTKEQKKKREIDRLKNKKNYLKNKIAGKTKKNKKGLKTNHNAILKYNTDAEYRQKIKDINKKYYEENKYKIKKRTLKKQKDIIEMKQEIIRLENVIKLIKTDADLNKEVIETEEKRIGSIIDVRNKELEMALNIARMKEENKLNAEIKEISNKLIKARKEKKQIKNNEENICYIEEKEKEEIRRKKRLRGF